MLFLCRPGGGKSRLKRNWLALKSTHSCRLASKIDTSSSGSNQRNSGRPHWQIFGEAPLPVRVGQAAGRRPPPPPPSGQRTPGFNSCHKSLVRRSHSGSVSCGIGRRRSCGSCVTVTVSRRNKPGPRARFRAGASDLDRFQRPPFPVSRRPRFCRIIGYCRVVKEGSSTRGGRGIGYGLLYKANTPIPHPPAMGYHTP